MEPTPTPNLAKGRGSLTMKSKHILALAFVGVGMLAVTGLVLDAVFNAVETRDKRHCYRGRPPVNTLAIVLDVSDPLIAAHPREIDFDISETVAGLHSGDRVLALDAAGKPPSEVALVVDECHPGDEDNTARNVFKAEIVGPIARHVSEIRSRPASAESPLVETIVGLASDRSVRESGTKLTIHFVTDGLQNSPLVSEYRAHPRYPEPDPALLKGVTVDLVVVKNDRDIRRQPRAVEHLVAWLKESGAVVVYSPPPWLLLADSKMPRHHRGLVE